MPEPRRAVRSFAAWAAAAVVAVAVASWGVALVGRSVTDARPAPLSAAEVEDRLAGATTTAPPTTSDTDPTASPPSTPGATPPTTPGPTVVGPAATVPSGSPGAAPPPTTAAPPPPTPPPTTVAPAPAGETRTYQLVGGTVSLRFEPAGVTVVFANPNQGFEVEQQPEGTGVRVELESDGHRSRVTGWWDGGPRDRVEEQPDGSGSGSGDDDD